MDHHWQAAKLCQGGMERHIDREGVPVDNSPLKECETVICFDSSDLSAGQ